MPSNGLLASTRIALCLATLCALFNVGPARADVVRAFTFSPRDVAVTPGPAGVVVAMQGAVPEGAPGGPELPAVAVFVELEAGQRVRSSSITPHGWVTLGTAPGRLRSAAAAQPGLPRLGSDPDAAIYASRDWFPAKVGTLGPTGTMRGRTLATLVLRPVRVRPGTSELEIATSIEVRLVTENDPTAEPMVRRRVVPEWEKQFDFGASSFGRGLEQLAPDSYKGARIESATGQSVSGGGFNPSSVPSVEGSPVEYLIITNAAMAAQMQRLADWRTRTGVPTVVRTLEFIQTTYPYGVDLQDRIRRFIKDAYLQWGTTHVLLGGDTEVIPARYGFTTFFSGNYIPSELYFSDLDGNWNADGDSLFGEAFQDSTNQGDQLNLLPDLYVGRAPVSNVAQAQVFVDKTLQYSRTPLGDYEDRALFAAEVLFPQDWNPNLSISLDGANDAESAIRKLTPEMKRLRLYENYTAYDSVGALQETRATVLDSLNIGRGIFHHVGHGYRNSMSVGDGPITNPDAEALTNGNRTWLLYSINCTSNAIDFASLGEAFCLNPNGGAVANVGSTREDFPVTGRGYQDEFYKLVFQDKVATLGQAFAQQKLPFTGFAFYDNTHRWTQFTLALLGDPAMAIWWRKPALLSVTYPANLPLSDTTLTVHVQNGASPLAGARVCLLKSGEEYEVAFTDGAGNALLQVRAETAGSALITVTDDGGFRPWEGTVTFGAPAGPVLASRAADRVIDDDVLGGTFGANDGAADAGETIDWRLPIKNVGSVSAASVTASLSTTDPRATISIDSSSFGTIGAGSTVNGTSYRIALNEAIPDGTEIAFRLDMFSGAAHWVDELRLPVRAPSLVHIANAITDNGFNGTTGNGNGRLDVGEAVDLSITVRNVTLGTATGLTATLSTTTPGFTIPMPNSTIGTLAAGASGSGTPFRVVSSSGSNPSLLLTINDITGVRYTRTIDLIQPVGVVGLVGTGAASSITLVWRKTVSGDAAGYNVYRSTAQAGPFARVNLTPTDRTAYYVDSSLPALTRFYYQIAVVDSSGNESSRSAVSSASTNPPLHPSFPLPTERNMPSSPAVANLDNSTDSSLEIVVGANVLYAWHADGTALRDADGSERTSGDFTTQGSYYAAGATLADLNGDGTIEIVAPSWETKQLFVFEPDGTNFPGFPKLLTENLWSTAAVGNIDSDPQLEIVFASRGNKFYAFNFDGTEVLDGDANPSTIGVFKVLGTVSNDGSPALADLDGDGKLDIIYGGLDGFLYAWRFDGTNLPGFPQNLFAATLSSAAVGDIDNDGVLEIAITSNNGKLNVYNANGTVQPGFPVTGVQQTGVSKYPSPALADMEGLGQKDIVINTTDGFVKVFRPNGTLLSQWTNVRYSYTAKASESSPVVADIDGDGQNEVIVGGEDANLYAFDNDGSLMAGFPIHLNGEVRGTPLVWDLDNDGLTEILLSCWDKNVYLWDYPGVFNPTGAPAWPMWRHDQFHQGRLGGPILVATNSVAFSSADGSPAGLGLTFALPSVQEASGRFDVYRAQGEGPVGTIAASLPAEFARINSEAILAKAGDLLSWNDASALPGETYRYLLVRRADRPGDAFLAYGPFAATASSDAPELAFVTQNFPNPIHNGRTTIAYGVPLSAGDAVHTTLRFFDVRGRVVRTLVDQLVPPGKYQATWDGKNDQGSRVGSGVYFYEYVAGPTHLRKKALFIAP